MRVVRLAIAALLAVALTVLPISAGLAMASATHAETSMAAPDEGCPCCDTAPDAAADICNLSCCGIAAILIGDQPPATPRCAAGAAMAAAHLSSFWPPPDPPPPRS